VLPLIAMLVAAEPQVSERTDGARPNAVSLHVVAGAAFGWAPGDRLTLDVGVRYRRASVRLVWWHSPSCLGW
jgi:hypothetical protein